MLFSEKLEEECEKAEDEIEGIILLHRFPFYHLLSF